MVSGALRRVMNATSAHGRPQWGPPRLTCCCFWEVLVAWERLADGLDVVQPLAGGLAAPCMRRAKWNVM